MKTFETRRGSLTLPTFLPDGTRGVVKSIDAQDASDAGVKVMMVNSFHLATHPGISTVGTFGGIHAFMGWDKPVMSDSGGFQIFSLIHESGLGSVHNKGLTYQSAKGQKKKQLTPEKCIQNQFKIGSDMIYCLDDCTHPSMPLSAQEESVKRTLNWAKVCKKTYLQRSKQLKGDAPKLFAVVQGGESHELRRQCAESLLELGFDGFGFGGWPIKDDGQLTEMLHFVSELIGPDFPKHALGVGKPHNLVKAYQYGYSIFDCVLPSRDARNKRLYTFETTDRSEILNRPDFYRTFYIDRELNIKDSGPLEAGCDCYTCTHFSKGYLNHLFALRDHLAYRLATIHNLRFYSRLTEILRHD